MGAGLMADQLSLFEATYEKPTHLPTHVRLIEFFAGIGAQAKANIYHQAGDSIVTSVLVGIFGELLGLDYKSKIEAYADKLHGEVADE